ncbi:hypothetical protein [Pontibacter harenae]|uniref:hypothetical protein n=1 Tax=Pontibacter harenae TaxID=2894083 RepID=UPI001E4CBF73|nr:hypothetical protein [Pontibacter harenae]MCC9167486.1 hypothetical protein [Pontibacter harenae]
MKKTFVFILIVASMYGCNQAQEATTATSSTKLEEQRQTAGNSYGAAFAEENVISTTALQEALSDKDSVQATVSAEVLESCKSKGC